MGKMRKLAVLAVATVGVGVMGVGVASAGLIPIGEVTLFSSAKWTASWDPDTNSTCTNNSPAYAPVDDGSIFSPVDGSYRSDAFDGGVTLSVNGTSVAPEYLNSDYVAEYVANAFGAGTRFYWPINGVTVIREDLARSKGSPTLRSLITLKNFSGSNKSVTLNWESNLGSDGSTGVRESSSGDNNFTAKDRWIVTSDTAGNVTPGDPVVTHVFSGKGKVKKPKLNPVCTVSTGDIGVTYKVKVPKKSTKYLLMFTEMTPTNKAGAKEAEKFDSTKKLKPLLKGLSSKQKKNILNWDL